jgi:hypothetical protein
MWSVPFYDPTGGCLGVVGWDADSDAVYEVLVTGADSFAILDGRTGVERFAAAHESATYYEHPVVADLDGDGSAEIAIVAQQMWGTWPDWHTLTVYGHADNAWPAAGPHWPAFDFAVTNYLPDGHVPATPEPPWQAFNTWRARPSFDGLGMNVALAVTDACAGSCADAGRVQVAAQVSNTGQRPVTMALPVRLYRDDASGRVLLAETELTPPLASGEAAAGHVFDVSAAEAGRGELVVTVDDGSVYGRLIECDEDDDEVMLPSPCATR